MVTYQVTIKQTITRVIKVDFFEPQGRVHAIKDQVLEYGIVEAFNDFPEWENLGSQDIQITKVRKVK